MSTEEIVQEINNGNTGLISKLWDRVQRLVYKFAVRYYTATKGRGGVTVEDLAQTGFVAMMDAIPRYNPSEAAFSTFLVQYLRKHFQEASGRLYLDASGRMMPRDALNASISIHVPVGDNDGDTELLEVLEDPNTATDSAEEVIWREQLRDTVSDVLRDLPEDQQGIIRGRYWMRKSFDDLAENMDISSREARKIEDNALRSIRGGKSLARLKPFMHFDYYGGTGLGVFKSTGASVQERYILQKERRRR